MPSAGGPCRCGHPDRAEGAGPHPCHGAGYACRQPARRRLYGLSPLPPSSGLIPQARFSAEETWACDACWADYSRASREGPRGPVAAPEGDAGPAPPVPPSDAAPSPTEGEGPKDEAAEAPA
jgi:hypothetical protein